MAANLVVKSAVKEYVASRGLRTGSDFLDKLNHEIEKHLMMAINRAKNNNRSTVQARDM